MAEAIEKRLFTLTSGIGNNNKFYNYTRYSDGRILCEYGRIGNKPASVWKTGGSAALERLARERTRSKGYVEVTDNVADATNAVAQSGAAVSQERLSRVAATALMVPGSNTSVEIDRVIQNLVSQNRHEILEASGGKIEAQTDGIVRTPLGIVTTQTISRARSTLAQMVASPTDISLVDNYLTLIPQKVPAQRGWGKRFLTSVTTAQDQADLLDQLEQSIQWYESNRAAAESSLSQEADEDYSALFRYRLRPLDTDSEEFEAIRQQYSREKNTAHQWSYLKPQRAFALVTPESDESEFRELAKKLGNVRRYWHGSRAFNTLSILRRGLFVPPRTGGVYSHSGRMFGDGVYTSRDASKSLGYSCGRSGIREENCYMFLADVIMGEECRSTTSDTHTSVTQRAHHERSSRNGKPYNSIEVNPHTCRVINHEAIVWNDRQVQLRYLVEFDR